LFGSLHRKAEIEREVMDKSWIKTSPFRELLGSFAKINQRNDFHFDNLGKITKENGRPFVYFITQ